MEGEKRDRNVEAPVPAQARIGLAGVVFLDFRSTPAMVKPKIRFARGERSPAACAATTKTRCTWTPERGIFLVVDGIGGQAAGEKAAEIAVGRVRARLERQTGTAEQRVREAIAMANNEILQAARGQSGMGGHGLRPDRGGAG